MTWVDIGVVTGIVLFFCAVMYRALKGPIDLLLNGIKSGFIFLAEKASGGTENIETIRYD